MHDSTVLYMMCGLPGCGKSTWISKTCNNFPYWSSPMEVISTDEVINLIGESYDMTYNELFGNISYAFAERMMYKIAEHKIKQHYTILWDQTNLTVKTRARKLALFPDSYIKYAIFFDIPEDHEQRLASRPGKTIPPNVIEFMKTQYVIPTVEEGFDVVIKGN